MRSVLQRSAFAVWVGLVAAGSLGAAEQKEFMRLLRKFVHLHDQQNKPDSGKPRSGDTA